MVSLFTYSVEVSVSCACLFGFNEPRLTVSNQQIRNGKLERPFFQLIGINIRLVARNLSAFREKLPLWSSSGLRPTLWLFCFLHRDFLVIFRIEVAIMFH
jgi:hypothetical protein